MIQDKRKEYLGSRTDTALVKWNDHKEKKERNLLQEVILWKL